MYTKMEKEANKLKIHVLYMTDIIHMSDIWKKASQDSVSLTLNQISPLILNFQIQNLQPKGVCKKEICHINFKCHASSLCLTF